MLSPVPADRFGAIVVGAPQAGVVIAMIPCMAVFLVLQRYHVADVTLGSVKG
ncbi:hypothetical protein [Spongiactinospora rosea]|uniref:hypothetical protein n=1 Tax=Spongiactinospora rosea TaxID=2248750 RepID=UPI001314710D|nr:hypothetical protein [Spongiactinospora rosea]